MAYVKNPDIAATTASRIPERPRAPMRNPLERQRRLDRLAGFHTAVFNGL
jgi:hypothetical protein